jgi:CheY-like chemotaxis protein
MLSAGTLLLHARLGMRRRRLRRHGNFPMLQQKRRPCLTVLIVDDEPVHRIYAAELAEEAGFTTLEASNADEALAALRAAKEVEVVVTDLRMPGSMDGLGLAAAVRDERPNTVVVIASGHTRRLDAPWLLDAVILPKPFTPNELIGVLRGAALRRELQRT